MSILEEKVQRLLSSVQSQGDVYLFALFEREDGKWDILVSSDWGDRDPNGIVRDLSRDLVAALNKEELLLVSRIVVVPSASPAVSAFAQGVHVDSGKILIEDSNLFGLQIKRAVVFRALKPKAPTPVAS